MQQWHLKGEFISLNIYGSAWAAARGLINLVNIQGPGRIELSPLDCSPQVEECVDRLDPSRDWRNWWIRAAGVELSIGPYEGGHRQIPTFALPPSPSVTGCTLGINIGGRYARLVWLRDGRIDAVRRVDLARADDDAHVKGDVQELARSIVEHPESKYVKSIGIAWSAPRTAKGLRAMSLQMQRIGEAADFLHTGTLDDILSGFCGCQVRSWNDGEAAAAAEAVWRPGDENRSILVFKLGTSFASGLARGSTIYSLPMQFAKCLLAIKPIQIYTHPSVGLRGTARDLLGAEPIERTYRNLSGDSSTSYDDFCHGVVVGEDVALLIIEKAADGLANLVEIAEDIWSAVDVVVSGNNVRNPEVADTLYQSARRAFARRSLNSRLLQPVCDVDLSAAMGAAMLSCATHS